MTGPDLRLLDAVSWQGRPVPGERPQALLAALAAHQGAVSSPRLIEAVWGDDPPERPGKALQVLVSRLRSIDRELVASTPGGYRLGLAPDRVDVLCLRQLVDAAATALEAGAVSAAAASAAAAAAFVVTDSGGDGPLAELRSRVENDLAGNQRVLGLAEARTGHAERAIALLRPIVESHPDDTEARVALLRAEAAAGRVAEALAEYADYRADLADRLGIDPDPELQRVHVELLAADSPVRTGLRYDSDPLVGREDDLARLRDRMADGRLVSIVGPGGIGKTRIAQVLAQEATQPHVHVVELVGVGSGDDVTAQVGTALGVRGSVRNRGLTPAQLADVRSRIVQELDTGPTLLVLDNCEHVLEQVAGLVATLLVSARGLTVVTTSRAPLRVAAEQVVPLTQLSGDEAAALFRRRVLAVRPQAHLDDQEIDAVVGRLDGLPLAIELAAARVRTLTVAEVDEALTRRFDALRSRDRTAPERHRTLAAVIGWSWDLLTEQERQALAWMSVFHDGFDLAAVRVMLGPTGPDLVESLVEQSMLVHGELGGRSRFRALETIREYATLRLEESGGLAAAVAAQDSWAVAATPSGADLFLDWDQIRVVDGLVREQGNLTDVLRRAIGAGDQPLVAHLVSALASLWTITGDHPRVFAIAEAAAEALVGYVPAAGQERVAQDAIAGLVLHLSWLKGESGTGQLMAGLLAGEEVSPWARAARVMVGCDETDGPVAGLVAEADATDPAESSTAAIFLLWAAIICENDGRLADAAGYLRRALDGGRLPPYLSATVQSTMAQMMVTAGDYEQAARLAEAAAPTLERLHAVDDACSMWITVALARMISGDIPGAARQLDLVEERLDLGQQGSRMMLRAARAEIAIAAGDVDGGLAGYDRTVELVSSTELPIVGISPWLAMAGSACLAAHARHASSPTEFVQGLRSQLRAILARMLSEWQGPGGYADLPFTGSVMVGLACAALRWGSEDEVDQALGMLAAAHCWSYNRALPVLAWEHCHELAERRRPGGLDIVVAGMLDLTAGDVRTELLKGLSDPVTSSG